MPFCFACWPILTTFWLAEVAEWSEAFETWGALTIKPATAELVLEAA